MSVGRRLPRSVQGLLLAVLVVLVVDAGVVGYASARSDQSDVLVPYGTTVVPTAFNPGIDAYAMSGEELGLPDLRSDERVTGPVDAQLRHALAALVTADESGDQSLVKRAGRVVRTILTASDVSLVRHQEKARDPDGYRLPTGWVSAETQGLLLSATSRLTEQTGDKRWQQAADRVFATLLRFQGGRDADDKPFEPWVSFVDQYGFLWFERFPQAPERPSLTVTAHGTAVLGIYDYAQIASGEAFDTASVAFARGAGTMLHFSGHLVQERVPAWTSIWQTSRALQQHRALTAQFRSLAEITGMPEFGEAAEAMARAELSYENLLKEFGNQPYLTPDQARDKADRLLPPGDA
jgi:hypothetical protein